MDAIKGILAEYYWIFLIVGILVLVTLIGFISSVKKKYTKNNKIMAFITIEDIISRNG